MRVDGAAQTTYVPKSIVTGIDAQCSSVQSEIERISKQLEQLSNNNKLSEEEKEKKKKEYQDQIRDLTQTLESLKLEKMKEEKEQAEHVKQLAREAKRQQPDTDTTAVVMDQLSMEGLIKADTALSENDQLDQLSTAMKGQKGVLEQEIKTDAGRGVDTTYKSKQASDLTKNISQIEEKMGKNIREADVGLDAAREADDDGDENSVKRDENHNGIDDDKEKRILDSGQYVDEYR